MGEVEMVLFMLGTILIVSLSLIAIEWSRVASWLKSKLPKPKQKSPVFQDCSKVKEKRERQWNVTVASDSVTKSKICNTYDTLEEIKTSGQILKELGVKKEKQKRASKIASLPHGRSMDEKTVAYFEGNDHLDFRMVSFKRELDERGYIQLGENDHFGKLRSFDALLYIKKNLNQQGIKTRKIRNRLVPA